VAFGRGVGPQQVQWRLLPRLEAAVGDFGYGRGSVVASAAAPLTARGFGPLPGGVSAAVEVAAGASAGTVPGQALWYMGGPATVRGYSGAAAAGDGFWRARAELGTTFPVTRAVLFTDVAQTRGRGAFDGQDHRQLFSAGVGLSFVEGLLRLDLARAMRFRPGWRLNIMVDNVL
jgi:hemolysin activation/secretion protein